MHAAHPQQQHRGTLQAGHTLVINKHTVQVERYLSQGGFAHVYVVRTSNPINNVTQHVLKRIVVPDAASLAGVRKEVDIMRILRGHPNIVNFIDASWNALPNGTYEVFILMELCPGGGIIDMMNRRLRERLTEAEILLIFVDVCEAVACMHNLKPPLLHRDLKVENILQHSSTRYKLCDFGSSTPVAPRPPSSSQEIRALEADLNKHTTLQYRAPEMVDVYLRRPVDEKSDVWALGVLLYKLCYYTTPFEEHGPLAILSVQYRIPPYPVYSPQMNSLIASMLRELGAQRPSVFEILDQVHRMRGTKSQFQYNIPAQSSLRPQPQVTLQSGLKDVLSFRTLPTPPATSNSAAQARQTVLDAIAPMRRGRPTAASPASSSPSVPQQETELNILKFEEQWNAIKAESSGNANTGWEVAGKEKKTTTKAGFGDNFDGFGDSISGSKAEKTIALSSISPSVVSRPRSNSKLEVKKDAFDGLGISRSREPSPTLGEVSERRSKAGANTSTRPPPLNAVSRTPVLPSMAVPLSPRIPASRTGLATYRSPVSLTVEERFPSLEELNKGWQPGQMPTIPPTHATSQPDKVIAPSQEVAKASLPSLANTAGALRPSERKMYSTPLKGPLRSSEVTGKVMRDHLEENATIHSKMSPAPPSGLLDRADKRQVPIGSSPTKYRPSRPALARKHRSSVSIKYAEPRSPPADLLQGDEDIIAKGRLDTPPAAFSNSTTPIIPVLGSATKSAVPGTSSNISPDTVIRGKHGFDLGEYSSSPTTSKREDNLSQSPPKAVRQLMDTVRQTQDSSSDEAEGPEDVNGHVLSDHIRRQRAKGRQSSVHDLVDLYGGSGRSPTESERKSPSPIMGKKGRRTSGVLVDVSVPSPALPQSALLSPSTIVPESRAELASLRSGSSSREVSPPTSLPDSGERVSHPPSRVSPAMVVEEQRLEKPRPQSMFIFPSLQSADLSSVADSPGGARRRHSPRRGSISEMVDLYENLAGTKSKNPPAIAKKPAGLRLNKTPSPIASRFPPVSPTGASFSPNQVTGFKTNVSKVKPKPRRSPTTDSYNVYSGQQQEDDNDLVSRVPRQQSPSRTKTTSAPGKLAAVSATSPKPVKPPPLSIPKLSNKTAPTMGQRTPAVETPISAPSPERPYQGVGKLIDQWQRKSEEAEAARLSRPKSSGRPLGPRAAAAGRAR